MLQSSPAISNMHISNLFSSPARLDNCSNSNCNKEKSWEVLKKLCLTTLRRIFSLKFKSRMTMFCQKLWTNCSKSSNSFKVSYSQVISMPLPVTFSFVTCYLFFCLLRFVCYLFFSCSNNSSSSIVSFIYYFFIFDSILTKMTHKAKVTLRLLNESGSLNESYQSNESSVTLVNKT